MTKNELIKALECCSKADEDLYNGLTYKGESLRILIKEALDLINRQKSKIKEFDEKNVIKLGLIDHLKAEIERLIKDIDIIQLANVELYSALDNARAEAITEFAERLKANAYVNSTITGYHYMVVDVSDIDQIAKEMKEGVTDTNVGCKEKGEQ